jgi:hypothetical protein
MNDRMPLRLSLCRPLEAPRRFFGNGLILGRNPILPVALAGYVFPIGTPRQPPTL